MATTISYNNNYFWSGIAPVPFVSRDIQMIKYGTRWGQLHRITLDGQITGQCSGFDYFVAAQRQILTGFHKDYQQLKITDNGSDVLTYDNVKVAGISFDPNNYGIGILPFRIELESYPSGYFSGQYGVLEPNEQFSFNEAEDGLVTVEHVISAKGFVSTSGTTNDALMNARNWVAARTGWSSQVLPAFISNFNTSLCLQTVAESYDRLNATYEIKETYLSDTFDNGVGILRYTSDVSSGIEDGITTVRIDGEIKGCRYQDLTSLRSRYSNFDAFNEAVNALQRAANRNDLNPNIVTKSLSEDQKNKVIGFNYVYDDDARPKVYIIYDIDFEFDYENDIISASIQATIAARGAYTSEKWEEVLDVGNAIDLYSVLVPSYNAYVNLVAPHLASFPLNPVPKAISRTENEFQTILIRSATYDNSPTPPPGFKKFDYNLNFSPAIRIYKENPILNGAGSYYIFDMGYSRRASCQIRLDAVGDDTITKAQVQAISKTQVLNIINNYFQGTKRILDGQEISESNAAFDKTFSVSADYSAYQSDFTVS